MDCPFYNALSPIHGRGLFSNQYFPVGTMLFKISDLDGNVTSFGKFVNHYYRSNIIVHMESDGYYAVASMPIFSGQEIVGNYRHTPDCLDKGNAFL